MPYTRAQVAAKKARVADMKGHAAQGSEAAGPLADDTLASQQYDTLASQQSGLSQELPATEPDEQDDDATATKKAKYTAESSESAAF